MITRTLDLAAAREVLGLDVTPMLWHEFRRDTFNDLVPANLRAYICNRCGKSALRTPALWSESPVCEPPVAPYSTDLAAAWQLVEHFRARGYWVRVQEMPDDRPFYWDAENLEGSEIRKRAICLIEGFTLRSQRHDGRGYGDTAAEAICRAALSAVRGVEVGRDE